MADILALLQQLGFLHPSYRTAQSGLGLGFTLQPWPQQGTTWPEQLELRLLQGYTAA